MTSLPAVKQLGSDDSTSLSPRLRHLLIQEDRSTGKLYIPNAAASSSTRPTSQGSSSRPSPPGSPFAFPISPFESPAHLPRLASGNRPPYLAPPAPDRVLPEPRDRPPSGSIASLLGHDGQPRQSLPALLPSRYDHPLRASAPSITFAPRAGAAYYTAAQTCPIEPSANDRNSPFVPSTSYLSSRPSTGSSLGRSDYVRRHSGEIHHPHRQAAAPYPPLNTMTSSSHHASSSRAPISRTTKACNACRNRKVRCDSGGPGAQEGTSCGRCRDAGIECVYSGIQKKRGPCPGAMRPSSATQRGGRRGSSTRSSIASLAPVTPPEDSFASSRNSYGFAHSFPHQANPFHAHQQDEVAPGLIHRQPPANFVPPPREQIHSWPGPAEQREKRAVVFDEHYTMSTQERSRQEDEGRRREPVVLPPLRIAIGHKENYFE